MDNNRLLKLKKNLIKYSQDTNVQLDFGSEDGDAQLLLDLINFYFENKPRPKTFTNVNIGVDRSDESTIDQIEGELEVMGVYFDHDGGDEKTYNINAGFHDSEQAGYFVDRWKDTVYIETETFNK